MNEADEIIETPPFVMVPVEMIRGGATKNAILCFVAMGSFGPESRARVSSIAARMRVKEKQIVRDAQTELIERGFLKMLTEAREHKPRTWALWPFRAKEEKQAVGKTDPLFNSLPEIPSPKQINRDETDNSNKADQKPLKAGKHPDQDAFWKFAQPTFKAITGQALSWPRTPTFQKQITEGLAAHGVEELTRRWDNYMADPYAQSRSLLGFFYDLDKWITRRTKLPIGGNNARAFHQPTTDWKPSGLKAPH